MAKIYMFIHAKHGLSDGGQLGTNRTSSDKFLVNMCEICGRLTDLGNNSNLRHRSLLGSVACFITARMCCQACMGSQRKTKEQLFGVPEESGAQIIKVGRNVMDSKSSLYAVL